MYNSKITGLGYYVPENIVTNNDLKEFMETTDEWIQERTGIKERRWIDPKTEDTTAVMGAKAARIAIERSGLTKDEIDFIVFATLSPDMYFPGGGVQVQELLDMPTIGALDVRNQCSGFICLVGSRSIYQNRDVSKYFGDWCRESFRRIGTLYKM